MVPGEENQLVPKEVRGQRGRLGPRPEAARNSTGPGERPAAGSLVCGPGSGACRRCVLVVGESRGYWFLAESSFVNCSWYSCHLRILLGKRKW